MKDGFVAVERGKPHILHETLALQTPGSRCSMGLVRLTKTVLNLLPAQRLAVLFKALACQMPDLIGYLGPDVLVPLASIIAAIIGFLLAMGKLPFHFAAKILRKMGVMKSVEDSASEVDAHSEPVETGSKDQAE